MKEIIKVPSNSDTDTSQNWLTLEKEFKKVLSKELLHGQKTQATLIKKRSKKCLQVFNI